MAQDSPEAMIMLRLPVTAKKGRKKRAKFSFTINEEPTDSVASEEEKSILSRLGAYSPMRVMRWQSNPMLMPG